MLEAPFNTVSNLAASKFFSRDLCFLLPCIFMICCFQLFWILHPFSQRLLVDPFLSLAIDQATRKDAKDQIFKIEKNAESIVLSPYYWLLRRPFSAVKG